VFCVCRVVIGDGEKGGKKNKKRQEKEVRKREGKKKKEEKKKISSKFFQIRLRDKLVGCFFILQKYFKIYSLRYFPPTFCNV